jgi:glycosyltransferase involved in cell wall biosynthesis
LPSVVHLVITDKFAGVERYVASTARELARRGWEVAVVGGEGDSMARIAGDDVQWVSGAAPFAAAKSVARLGRRDVCHAHMTLAELVAVTTRPFHRARLVSTRHFASRRGSSTVARVLAPLIARCLSREIAVSDFVSERMERRPEAVIVSGVSPTELRWSRANRIVLVLQRLEPEKDTLTALRSWHASNLAEEGWSLRVVGDGSERASLERWVEEHRVVGVEFAGWREDVDEEFGRAGMLIAPGGNDSLGLSVLEAMAAGVPVVACGSGGHRETVGRLPGAPSFPRGDAGLATEALRSLVDDDLREQLSAAGRRLVATDFSVASHVDRLLEEYAAARNGGASRSAWG